MDRAPSLEAGSPGAFAARELRIGRPRCACRWPLKAASFRTWPGSRADIARDPAINAPNSALTPRAW